MTTTLCFVFMGRHKNTYYFSLNSFKVSFVSSMWRHVNSNSSELAGGGNSSFKPWKYTNAPTAYVCLFFHMQSFRFCIQIHADKDATNNSSWPKFVWLAGTLPPRYGEWGSVWCRTQSPQEVCASEQAKGSLHCCSTDRCLCWGHLLRMQRGFDFSVYH